MCRIGRFYMLLAMHLATIAKSRGYETRSATATAADRDAMRFVSHSSANLSLSYSIDVLRPELEVRARRKEYAGSEQSSRARRFARKRGFPRVRRGIMMMILGESSIQNICCISVSWTTSECACCCDHANDMNSASEQSLSPNR